MRNKISKKIKAIGMMICLVLFGDSEGMNLTLFKKSEGKSLPLRSTLSTLIKDHRDKLRQSKVYIAVTVHNQIPFIPNLRWTLGANVTELTQYGVQSHVIITCDGIKEDFTECKERFKDFPLPSESLQILFNRRDENFPEVVSNQLKDAMNSEEYTDVDFSLIDSDQLKHIVESKVGVSLARWKQLNYIHELMKEDEKNNLSTYFCIFDGDDIFHKDFVLIALLALLETGADVVSPGNYFNMFPSESLKEISSSGNIVRCKLKDSPEILKRASKDVSECLITEATHFVEFSFNLFDGKVLEKVLSKDYKIGFGMYRKSIDPRIDFATLFPFQNALIKENNVFLLNVLGGQKYQTTEDCYDPTVAPFFDEQNEQNTLFYYMQHDDSLEGNVRKAQNLLNKN